MLFQDAGVCYVIGSVFSLDCLKKTMRARKKPSGPGKSLFLWLLRDKGLHDTHIPPFHDTDIPSFHNTRIPPLHDTNIPPFHDPHIPPFHDTHIPPFRRQPAGVIDYAHLYAT